MTDETEFEDHETPESEFLDPSPVGAEYMRHEAAMEPAKRVPVHKAFAVGPGYNVGMLRMIASFYKPKKLVVIDHGETGFEVRRIEDNASIPFFYDSLQPEKLEMLTATAEKKQFENISKVIREFLKQPDADISKYDARAVELRAAGCVSYAYMQRRLAPTTLFRNDSRGSTEALKAVFSEMESEGFLRRLEKSEAGELFNTTSAVYRINKGAF